MGIKYKKADLSIGFTIRKNAIEIVAGDMRGGHDVGFYVGVAVAGEELPRPPACQKRVFDKLT